VPCSETVIGNVGGSVTGMLALPKVNGLDCPAKLRTPVSARVSWLGEFTEDVRPVMLIVPLNPAAVQ
jgi:hypothetical protein